jgi:hypothetical protein
LRLSSHTDSTATKKGVVSRMSTTCKHAAAASRDQAGRQATRAHSLRLLPPADAVRMPTSGLLPVLPAWRAAPGTAAVAPLPRRTIAWGAQAGATTAMLAGGHSC